MTRLLGHFQGIKFNTKTSNILKYDELAYDERFILVLLILSRKLGGQKTAGSGKHRQAQKLSAIAGLKLRLLLKLSKSLNPSKIEI